MYAIFIDNYDEYFICVSCYTGARRLSEYTYDDYDSAFEVLSAITGQ
jgi:hypothetical protein